jgi:two-component system, chemotaxis family, protein-glutamate methylesterase/glutaminase
VTEENKKVFALPGDIVVSKQKEVIGTLLGSCVAICLYHRKGGWGGLNHYMMPRLSMDSGLESGKYGDYSLDKLIQRLLLWDGNIRHLEAKVYGGGDVVGHLSSGRGIGMKNIMFAQERLHELGINIIDKDVGSDFGRKIYFNTQTGEVEVLKIAKSDQAKAMAEKKKSLEKRAVRVLIVDDSPLIRSIISKAITVDPNIIVVGEAENPYDAREKIIELDPDVVTLDIIMPRMDGITFLEKLMRYKPIPTIIVSSVAQEGKMQWQKAKEAGAVEVLDKAKLNLYAGVEGVSKTLIPLIKRAAMTIFQK